MQAQVALERNSILTGDPFVPSTREEILLNEQK